MAQITFNNVDMGYEGKPVVRGVSFQVSQGDYLIIVGENGTGKSTLMKTLLGIISPLKGEIDNKIKLGHIGYLPQQTALQRDFPALAREIVLSGFINKKGKRPFYNRVEKGLAAAQMAQLGITHLAQKSFRELSGGQQQRVLLARALCAAENVLLLDEPVTGLDPGGAKDMYELIQYLNRESGITVIMVSHDIYAVKEYASHVLHLTADRHFYGPRQEYMESALGKRFLLKEGGGADE